MTENRRVTEKTDKEKLADYEKLAALVAHEDWPLLMAYIDADRKYHQDFVDAAPNWETYCYSRGARDYITKSLFALPEIIRSTRDELEERISNPSVDAGTNPLED